MTRARALKDVIRARAAKTGERYTAARRHVLNALQTPATRVTRASRPLAAVASSNATPALAARATMDRASAPHAAKGGVSDAKSREKTGHGLDYWFDVLDRFGAVEKGHSAAARHLFEAHGVGGWYSQGITVVYERARGVRATNQRCDGEYEVSVSKVVAAPMADVLKAFSDPRVRRRWMKDTDAKLSKALASALDGPTSKGIVTRPDGLGRFRYKWGSTTVQFYFVPKPGGKVSVVVTNSALTNATTVEDRRGQWRSALNGLSQLFVRAKKRPVG